VVQGHCDAVLSERVCAQMSQSGAWCMLCVCPDVVVHRLLAAALGLTRLPEKAKDKHALTDLTDSEWPSTLSL